MLTKRYFSYRSVSVATWGLHIRVTERLLQIFTPLDCESFIVGNIAPDCGKPNEDWSKFDPPSNVTHWKDENKNIEASLFCRKYLSSYTNNLEYSFLLGYYTHLLTDIEWFSYIDSIKEHNEHYHRLEKEPEFIWTIKKDWYDLDHLYFRNNPKCIFWTIFRHITKFPDYLDYLPSGAIIDRIKYITDFYGDPPENLDRKYKYLTMNEMEIFLKSTIDILSDKINIIHEKFKKG